LDIKNTVRRRINDVDHQLADRPDRLERGSLRRDRADKKNESDRPHRTSLHTLSLIYRSLTLWQRRVLPRVKDHYRVWPISSSSPACYRKAAPPRLWRLIIVLPR